jgi:hypothetical protein
LLLPLTLELQTAGTFFPPLAPTFSSMPCDRFLVLSVLYCKGRGKREHTSTSTQLCSKDFTIHEWSIS